MYSNDDALQRLSAAANRLLAQNEQIYVCAGSLAVTALRIAEGDVETAGKLLHNVEDFLAAAIDYMHCRSSSAPLLDVLAGYPRRPND